MSFIPHTPEEIQSMLEKIGIQHTDELFDEIPKSLLYHGEMKTPGEALNEMSILRQIEERAEKDRYQLSFLGAGAYEHHIPTAVWDITNRGEFLTSYTPYQAEASQGTLQLLYEYQSMIARLTALDVSNASLYDGASALAEAILMSIRLHQSARKVLIPRSVSPFYRATVKTIVSQQNIELVELPYTHRGITDLNFLDSLNPADYAALVIPQPNFFGCLEDVDALSAWAKTHKLLSIALVNPISLACLKPPGAYGADIACGEGQPLGIPLSSGGPYFGFLSCKKEWVRQMPGRIVGRTVDKAGKQGFVLTLQAREQHIRRSKATSNICTNQSLLVTAATIYMSLLGDEGLYRVATSSHEHTACLAKQLSELKGVSVRFDHPFFHEVVLQFSQDTGPILNALMQKGILGGYDLSQDYPELKNCLLLCATETKTQADILKLYESLKAVLVD